MKDESTNLFLKTMVGSVYKILPMHDSNDKTLSDHLDSLYVQLVGGSEFYTELKNNQRYNSVITTIQYFRNHFVDSKTCKREILRSTNILDKLSKL